METFDLFWQVHCPKEQYANRKRACYKMWQELAPDVRLQIIADIKDKKANHEFVDHNPLFAIRRYVEALNQLQALPQAQGLPQAQAQLQPRVQTLSYNDYYDKFGTTEEKDGWKMTNPTGNKVIYVKTLN